MPKSIRPKTERVVELERQLTSALAALRDRYDEAELRPRIAELVSEIETGKC